ncbi:MAG TPA: serine hydrolase domain-containing protein [Ignavibacteria bacterium]|nr:serine hydrolase domain-containing protein [Ignavibacteria bacterium]
MKKPIFFIIIILSAVNTYARIDSLKIDKIIQDQISGNNFEGTVLIAENSEIVYQKSAGYKDRETLSLIDNDTKFGIASITKMLTAILVLQLVDEGKLSLQDNVKDLLPELGIPKGDSIKVHHLLLHISGLPNENDFIFLNKKSPEEFVRETLIIKGESGKFGKFNYANIDYVLLGLIIEMKTGKNWQEVMTENIISKLGLKNTGFLSDLQNSNYSENFAYSYSVSDEGEFAKDPEIYIENFYAAGSMYSNAADLLAIDQAMYGNKLLSESSKVLMFTSYPEYNYTGYSVWTYNYPFSDAQPKIMERRGGIMGWNSVLVRFLDENKTIIILSNNNRFNPDSFGDKENLREALIMELGSTTTIIK